ncbi:hypothetical protein CONCODRAFT_11608, partial [Conidiobolus coronatus NRRL 28638]
MFAAYRLYRLFKVPPELKDIPAAPLMTFIRYIKDKRSFGDKVEEYFQSQLNEFGAIRVLTHLGWTVFIGSPKLCKEVSTLSNIFEKIVLNKSKASFNFLRFVGDSQVASTNGQEWKKQRKIINPIFNQTWSTEMFGNSVQDLIDEWEKMEGD